MPHRPSGPHEPAKPPLNLIEIPLVRPAAGRAQAQPSRSREYWKDYYRTHDESSAQLKETVTLLNRSQKFQEVYEALLGYLTYRNTNREPWMYEAMALAIEMNKGKPEDVKKTLGYAADMALETRNPNDLVSVADLLFLHKAYERVGPLLDLAAEKVPHRSEPLIMSINLARVTKDPKRMGDAVARLLELGWPGDDDRIRLEARQQAESLAKTLREEGRDDEAEALLARLPEAEARDLFLRLTWVGDADLDLVVEEPLGATARYQTPRTVFGGSILKNGYGSHPEEVYVCPRAFDGDYTIRVETIATDPPSRSRRRPSRSSPRGDARRAEAGPDDQARPGDDPGRGLLERGATEDDLALRRPRPGTSSRTPRSGRPSPPPPPRRKRRGPKKRSAVNAARSGRRLKTKP